MQAAVSGKYFLVTSDSVIKYVNIASFVFICVNEGDIHFWALTLSLSMKHC